MLNENAKAWVAALRSGEYEKTTGILKDECGYCCLGVGARISPIPIEEWGACSYLPDSVRTWLGLAGPEGNFRFSDAPVSLSYLNDHARKTFAEIADIIESEPEGLFA